ncbi:ATP-binding protein [Streptomyces sp. WI04-05B]|uniref:ATP-binding protein n=1 Tax=Streptomyces TaxID=1883 RepID=UPI0029B57BAB|nr:MULTISPECIES: ATP-binding protein [unclassified Streptomyces]MDX2545345.1 ATP-binding protein [Streptomyces sp. WI04-05B]MDX2588160.1 ATP-binding protein [Streptomyces sp. WI04-05A]
MPRARALAHAVLGEWGVSQDVLESAELVLSELVTNALRVPVPSDRLVGVRIARSLAEGLLRLEVSDAGSGRPEVRAPGDEETSGRGLLLVEALAHRWGVEERVGGIGKMVWAELKAPDLVAEPVGREVAAVLVRCGQWVRVWGEWRVVVGVRSERADAGESAVVLELDEGPALRVQAVEPLVVRQWGDV